MCGPFIQRPSLLFGVAKVRVSIVESVYSPRDLDEENKIPTNLPVASAFSAFLLNL